MYGLQDRLEALLGVPVDVTTEVLLKPHVRQEALHDALPLRLDDVPPDEGCWPQLAGFA